MSIFDRLFGQDPKDIFLQFSPVNSSWRVITWNFDISVPGSRRWSLEVQGERNELIDWERPSWDVVKFFRNGRLIRKRNMGKRNSELMALMNLSIHSTLKYALEINHPFMLTPVSGATTLDFQNESKALQWIEATFGTLMRALENLERDPDLVLTAACFSGKTPDTNEEVFRLIAFNLDIFYYLREDQSLQIVVFDDKNMGHGESKTPSFQQIIKVTKPQFYDEITKLVNRLAQIGEIH